MKYKHLETAREIRLWITGIVAPVVAIGAVVFIPELRNAAIEKTEYVKKALRNKFNK